MKERPSIDIVILRESILGKSPRLLITHAFRTLLSRSLISHRFNRAFPYSLPTGSAITAYVNHETHAERDRKFHNDHAHEYNQKHASGIELLTEEIRSRIDWIGLSGNNQARILDYACGTGLVSNALAPYVSQIIGIDLSEMMVEEYNKNADRKGLAQKAYTGNLVVTEDSPADFATPEFFDFDLVAIGLGFHHFSDPSLAAHHLASRLKPGGRFLIIDNVSSDNGFSHESAEKLFRDVGVGGDFKFSVIDRELQIGRGPSAWKQKVFIAIGSKT